MKRQSNIELLRIISMFGVIILHYNNPQIGGGLLNADGLNYYILLFLETICIAAVNLFVLIRGSFLSQSSWRTLIKPLELLCQVIIIKELIYVLKVIIGVENFSIINLGTNLIPSNWFVVLYIALYLISPMLNVIAEKYLMNTKKFIIILSILFSIFPTCVDILQDFRNEEIYGLSTIGMYGSQYGYTIVNFSLMYLIGAYIKLNYDTIKYSKNKSICYIIILTVILTIWAEINNHVNFGFEKTALEYCNPLVIMLAIQIFLIFSHLDLGSNNIINRLSKATFTVFLLHNVFLKFIKIEYFVLQNSLIMIFHIIISTIGIYFICWIFYEIYNCISKKIFEILTRKATFLVTDLYKEM